MPAAATDQLDDLSAAAGAAVGLSWLLMRIGSERYALPLASVAEVLEEPQLSPVPGLPPEVLGLAVTREGRLVVWDAAYHLGQTVTRPPAAVLVLRSDEVHAAVAVDEAADVALLDEDSIRQLPALDDPLQVVIGVARDEGGLITVLDVARVVRALAGGEEVAR